MNKVSQENREFEVGSLINRLIETCVSGHLTFEAAAGAIQDPSLKKELEEYGQQRRQFARDLGIRLRAFGDAPAKPMKNWISSEANRLVLSDAMDRTIGQSALADCEKRESWATDTYRKALGAPLPAEYSQIVEWQYEQIRQAHHRIKILQVAMANQWIC